MATQQMEIRGEAANSPARAFLEAVFRPYGPRDFSVRFPDGSTWEADPGKTSRFTIVLSHTGSARKIFEPPSRVSIGEAYVFGDYDVEGDFSSLFPLFGTLSDHKRTIFEKLQLWKLMRAIPSQGQARAGWDRANFSGEMHSIDRDKQAMKFHYDVSNDFFSQWLDRRMVYTCAYFETPNDSIDAAQEQKLDLICRKLRLKPGMRVLDIGCGWGGFVMYAAEKYGANATGVTLSKAQFEFAQQRIREAGMQDRCRVLLEDYREQKEWESYDRLVSIGMCEAVGTKVLPTYFSHAYKLLKPGGLFMNHGIHTCGTYRTPPGPTFGKLYVFPDGELQPVYQLLNAAEDVGFEVRDIESLREHYVMTLRHWVRRLEENREAVEKLTSRVIWKVWRFYMSGAAYLFESSKINLLQTLLHKHQRRPSGLPLTRRDWYS